MIERYETVPHEAEALQFTMASMGLVPEFTGSTSFNIFIKDGILNAYVVVGGVKMLLILNDYIVKDNGQILVMKQREFDASYRKIEEA